MVSVDNMVTDLEFLKVLDERAGVVGPSSTSLGCSPSEDVCLSDERDAMAL